MAPGAVEASAPAVAPSTVRLAHVGLRDFRNIARAALEVPPEGFVLVGRNGHGKTNVLEAIHYAHALRSMRGARDQDLVRFGAEAFHVALRVEGAAVEDWRVGVDRATRKKRLVLDGAEVTRLTDALGAIPSVVLSPRDVGLVTGAPQERRRFLDILLAATSSRYLHALQRYRATLARRNAVLRDAATRADGPALAAVWEPALAEAGAVLWAERLAWVRAVASRVRHLCARIGEARSVSVRYHTLARERMGGATGEAELAEVLRQSLAHDRAADIRRGLTVHGPHRDDLVLSLDGRLVRTFGSAGQQRTVALALRLVEAETLRERLSRDPILLLDDPFAELDRDRARGILGLLGELGGGQRILAVPREDDVPPEFTGLSRRVIAHGEVADGA